jgi:hypothetical protein
LPGAGLSHEPMNTNAKLAVVAVGLCIAAVALVVGLRTPRNGEATLAHVRPPPASLTPAERTERTKVMQAFRNEKGASHDRALKLLADAVAYSNGPFCDKGRRVLRNSMELYGQIRFTDIDFAVTQDFMSDEDIADLWDGPRDVNAIGQANFRLQHGFVLKEDFADWRADYLKIFAFPDEVTPACPGPLPRDR